MPALPGELNRSSRLSEQDVRDIRAGYVPGSIAYADLAEEYGVSRQLIHQIITKQIWKNVDAD